MIPYGRQQITDADVDAVVAVLRSDYLTQGPVIPRFERKVAELVGVDHAIAVNSATSALHIACLALELGPSDLLWTVPNTFVASANCARYCGADVDFVDIDSGTWNISVSALEARLIRAEKAGRLPKVLVAVHFGGLPTQQQEIRRLSKQYGFKVIEDASHSIGARRDGERVGSCRWSDITVFSFHPVKIVTSGEGGMALTNDVRLAERLALLRTHGITREVEKLTRASPGAWYYEQQLLGFNYRLTDLQAALGLSQLDRLDEYVERRNVLARRYDAAFVGLPIRTQRVDSGNLSAFHLYCIRIPADMPRSRDSIFEKMRTAGIGVNVHYTPVHLQPYYRQLGFGPGHCPEAEAHGAEVITLPLFPTLAERDQDLVMEVLKGLL